VVQEKFKKAELKLFTILDYQRILGVNYSAAQRSISRYIQAGFIVKVRKGLYFLKSSPPHEFEVANKVYYPSYISFETALSFYGIIPETIYEVISATPRLTREFVINNIKYSYKKIKRECFCGYRPVKIKGAVVLIAEPEKALADYLYFVALGQRELSYERIDLNKIKKARLLTYAKHFQKIKMREIINNIYDQSKRNRGIVY